MVFADVVKHEDDDVVVGKAIGVEYLISVADIRLVSVVIVAIGAGDEHSPLVGRYKGNEQCEDEQLHVWD